MDRKEATRLYLKRYYEGGVNIFDDPQLKALMPYVDLEEISHHLGTTIPDWSDPRATIQPKTWNIVPPKGDKLE